MRVHGAVEGDAPDRDPSCSTLPPVGEASSVAVSAGDAALATVLSGGAVLSSPAPSPRVDSEAASWKSHARDVALASNQAGMVTPVQLQEATQFFADRCQVLDHGLEALQLQLSSEQAAREGLDSLLRDGLESMKLRINKEDKGRLQTIVNMAVAEALAGHNQLQAATIAQHRSLLDECIVDSAEKHEKFLQRARRSDEVQAELKRVVFDLQLSGAGGNDIYVQLQESTQLFTASCQALDRRVEVTRAELAAEQAAREAMEETLRSEFAAMVDGTVNSTLSAHKAILDDLAENVARNGSYLQSSESHLQPTTGGSESSARAAWVDVVDALAERIANEEAARMNELHEVKTCMNQLAQDLQDLHHALAAQDRNRGRKSSPLRGGEDGYTSLLHSQASTADQPQGSRVTGLIAKFQNPAEAQAQAPVPLPQAQCQTPALRSRGLQGFAPRPFEVQVSVPTSESSFRPPSLERHANRPEVQVSVVPTSARARVRSVTPHRSVQAPSGPPDAVGPGARFVPQPLAAVPGYVPMPPESCGPSGRVRSPSPPQRYAVQCQPDGSESGQSAATAVEAPWQFMPLSARGAHGHADTPTSPGAPAANPSPGASLTACAGGGTIVPLRSHQPQQSLRTPRPGSLQMPVGQWNRKPAPPAPAAQPMRMSSVPWS